MRNRGLWVNLVLLLLVYTNVYGAHEIHLQDIINSVNQHYPLILAEQKNLTKAYAENFAAKGGFDPILRSEFKDVPQGTYQHRYSDTEFLMPSPYRGTELFMGYRNGQGEFPIYDGQNMTTSEGEVRAGVKFPLLRNSDIDETRAKIKETEYRIAQQKQVYALKKIDVMRQAAYAYWSWVGEGKKLGIYKHLLNLAIIRQNALKKRFQHGDAARIEVVENERLIIQRQAAFVMAERLFQKAGFELSLFYRTPEGQPLIPSKEQLPKIFPNIPTLSWNRVVLNSNSIIQQHPMIQELNQQIQISQVRLAIAKNSLLPKLNTQIYAARDMGPYPDPTHTIPINRESLNLGLELELPIYQRKARGDILSAQKTYERIIDQKQMANDQLYVELKDNFNALEAERMLVFMAKKEVELAIEVEQAETIRFNEGDSSIFLVNQREQSTADSQLKEIGVTVDYFKTKVELLSACGLQNECIQKFDLNLFNHKAKES